MVTSWRLCRPVHGNMGMILRTFKHPWNRDKVLHANVIPGLRWRVPGSDKC